MNEMRPIQEQAYNDWYKDPTKDNMQKIVSSVDNLIGSEVMRYQGTLKPSMLKSYAKKYVADAVKKFDSDKGSHISTHIINSLKRLHRLNYKNVQGLKSSEQVQSRMNTFLNTNMLLEDKLGRSPNVDELAKALDVTPKFIKRLKNSIKHENSSESDSFSIKPTYEVDPERDALDLVYHDSPDIHKKIIEYRTGYMDTPILANTDIAKKLNISPVRVSQISDSIGKKLKLFLST